MGKMKTKTEYTGLTSERTVEGVTFTNLRINGEWILECGARTF